MLGVGGNLERLRVMEALKEFKKVLRGRIDYEEEHVRIHEEMAAVYSDLFDILQRCIEMERPAPPETERLGW